MIFWLKRGEAVAASVPGDPPELLTSRSRRPWSATMVATRASTDSGSVTSAATKPTPSGSDPASGVDRPHTTTVAPAATSRSAMPWPTPRAPPVTSATCPLRSISIVMGVTLPQRALRGRVRPPRRGPAAGDRMSDICNSVPPVPPSGGEPMPGRGDRSDPSAGSPTLSYQPHLDGLRAIAVYLVVAFHAGVLRLQGGFIGVDVFFVLSGYLVTRLLVRDLDEGGRVRLARFYGRRFRRLLPAALLLLVATALVYPLIASPLEVLDARGAMRAASLWFSNWYFIARSADYFAADVQASPVLHFWSLSVEEQFYLAWPVLFGGLVAAVGRRARSPRATVRAIVAGAGVASLGLALWLARTDVARAYYGTDARAYQLLAGAVLALTPGAVVRYRRWATDAAGGTATWAGAVPWLALAALAAAASSRLELAPVPRGVAATVVTLVLIVSLSGVPGSARRILSVGPITYLGRISYGTYLWHWIVLLVLGATLELAPIPLAVAGAVVATGLASLSYQLVELPIRSSAWLDRRPVPVVIVAVAASLLVGTVVLPELLDRGAQRDRTQASEAPADAGDRTPVPADLDWQAAAKDHRKPPPCPEDDPDACTLVAGGEPHVLLLGDSHAAMYIDAFVGLAERRGFTLSVASTPGCLWPRGIARADNLEEVGIYGLTPVDLCRGIQDSWYDTIVPALDPDVIVLVHRGFDDPAAPLPVVDVDDDVVDPATPSGAAAFERLVRRHLDQLTAGGAQVVIVEPIPLSSEEDDPMVCLSGARYLEECRFEASEGPTPVEQVYRRVADEDPDVSTLDLDQLACPGLPTCDPVVDGLVVRWNHSHLTDTFARSLVGPLEQRLDGLDVLG